MSLIRSEDERSIRRGADANRDIKAYNILATLENISDEIRSVEVLTNKAIVGQLRDCQGENSMEEEHKQAEFAILYGTKLGAVYYCVIERAATLEVYEF